MRTERLFVREIFQKQQYFQLGAAGDYEKPKSTGTFLRFEVSRVIKRH